MLLKKLIIILLFLIFPFLAFAQPAPNWQQKEFWFRDDDGTQSTATGYGTSNAAVNQALINVLRGSRFRLRFGLNLKTLGGNITPRIEYRIGTTCDGTGWSAISSASSPFSLFDSSNFIDGVATTQQISSGVFVAGQILDSSNPASQKSFSQNNVTEYEWSIQMANDIAYGVSYVFRIADAGGLSVTPVVCPMLLVEPVPLVINKSLITSIKFFGRAYPQAKITLLEKLFDDEVEVIKREDMASDQSFFDISFSEKISGNRTYGILIEDKDTNRTPAKFYNYDIGLGANIYTEIFAAPTITLDRIKVIPNSIITLSGYATPKNELEFLLDGKSRRANFLAGDDGVYSAKINVNSVDMGSHTILARQLDNRFGKVSDWSVQQTFSVVKSAAFLSDFNDDGIINISDWSIFLSIWGKGSVADKQKIDLNNDGKTDISDFSLFIINFKK